MYMSDYWNGRIKNLSPYVPGEQPKDRKFIKLNTNENPYPPSPKVFEAIKKHADDALRLYPDPECTQLRETISACYNVKPSQVFAGNGSDEILAFAFGAFFESGSISQAALFPDITYSFYPVYAGLWDVPYKTIPLCEDFTVNINEYKISSGGVILPNPNAPTGIALPAEDVLSLAEFLEKQSKVIIIDEAYLAFSAQYDDDSKSEASCTRSAVKYIDKYKNLLTVHTLSKSASLAGLRAGFAIGDENLIDGLRRIRDSFNSYTLDRLALAGAAAAIADKDYYSEFNSRVIKTRQRVTQEMRALGCMVLPSSANFIFVKFPKTKGVDAFAKLRENGILVRHFNRDRIKDFLRVTIGIDEDMDKFLEVCKNIIIK